MSSQDACATTNNQADHLATLLRYLDAILRYLQRMDREQIRSRLGLRQTSFGKLKKNCDDDSPAIDQVSRRLQDQQQNCARSDGTEALHYRKCATKQSAKHNWRSSKQRLF
eukprot:gb/GEZN01012970.1/.p2 GENE.gb/GEZN01012970.1/~~gb/GEZN01012970.1/.p2  ORF type:complete len:111 (-),score=14.71 gb/GEZN01012970.1/:616-948(-)